MNCTHKKYPTPESIKEQDIGYKRVVRCVHCGFFYLAEPRKKIVISESTKYKKPLNLQNEPNQTSRTKDTCP